MLTKLRDYAAATGQPAPETPGQAVRCCLESLALCYRRTLDALESLLGRRIELLHIVGGGGRNELLNQMTADALGRPVIVGPYEATAVGNALTQAIGLGLVKNLADLRHIVRASFDLRSFEPRDPAAFEMHLPRFDALRERTITGH
jgi:rhamnulokinase